MREESSLDCADNSNSDPRLDTPQYLVGSGVTISVKVVLLQHLQHLLQQNCISGEICTEQNAAFTGLKCVLHI